MPRFSVSAFNAALAAFVKNFSVELNRSARRQACTDYLTELLRGGARESRRTKSRKTIDALRYFVGRGLWEHEASLKRLRGLLFSRLHASDGVLLFCEVQIPRRSPDILGCDRQKPSRHRRFRPHRRQCKCQTLLLGFWVNAEVAWPVSVRLFLPLNWTMRKRRLITSKAPASTLTYRSKTTLTLEMLDEIATEAGHVHPVLVDEALARYWGLLENLAAKGRPLVATLHPLRPWPMMSDVVKKGQSIEKWSITEKLRHARNNESWVRDALKEMRKKRTTIYEKSIRDGGHGGLPGFERSLLLWAEEKAVPKIYLRSGAAKQQSHAPKIANFYLTAQKSCDHVVIKGGLRRHEGNSWRGLHRHITLCFLAEHFRLQKR